ncbi:MAG: hypothetical protein HY098_08890 [Nitrospinae bacterium]|nr:hypothetical protein [Nitrospinota bacterium]
MSIIFAPGKGEAVPSFARQVGVSCFACHYQHMLKLNSFGRDFKLGGYTRIVQETMEDEGFSFPSLSNISLITHLRYLQDNNEQSASPNQVGAERGSIQIPSDAVLWIAGRLGEHFGFGAELPGPIKSPKIIYSRDFGGIQGGVVVAATDAMGAAYGMELFNTGAVENHREWDNNTATYVQQALGGPAVGQNTGVNLFAGGSRFFANVGLFAPASITAAPGDNGQAFCGNGVACGTGGADSGTSAAALGLSLGNPGVWGGTNLDTGLNLSLYYRLALTPKITDGADFMVGIQGTSGSTKGTFGLVNAAGAPVESTYNTNTLAFDAQAQADVAGMSLEVTAAYQTNASTALNLNGAADVAHATRLTAAAPGYTNGGNGFDVNASLGINKSIGVRAAYLNYTVTKGRTNDGTNFQDKSLNAVTVGAWYNVLQNANFELSYTAWGGDLTNGTNGNTNDAANQLVLHLIIGI